MFRISGYVLGTPELDGPMPNFCRKSIVLAVTVLCMCSGCTQLANKRLKSPVELIHSAAFGGSGLTTSEYLGSDHAREWAMAEHAEAMAKQQAMQANAPGSSSL